MTSLQQIFWISLLVKLALAAFLPLTNDEAYYWVWSQHLQLSYYDHPAMVAWLYWLGDFTRGFPGSVRWPGVLMGHLGLWIWIRALGHFLDPARLRLWLWLCLLSPLVGGSALIVTPDLPLLFFYGLALFMYFKWLDGPTWKTSLLFGLAMGLGFAGKYMMVLFALGLLPLIVLSSPVRQALVRQIHWLVLGAVLGAAPVWLWNFMHDFASFKFQATHGLGRRWKPSWTVEYVAAQIGILFPVVLYWALRARRLPLVFHLLAWTPLIFFFFTTFRGYVEANWPIAAYPLVFALAVSAAPLDSRSLKITAGIWGTLLAALAAVVLMQPEWSRKLKFKEFHQFDAVIEAGKSVQPLYARSYQMAAKMHFELGRPIYKLKGMNRRDFYDYLEGSIPPEGTYYLAAEKIDQLPLIYSAAGHRVVERIPVDEKFEIWKVETR